MIRDKIDPEKIIEELSRIIARLKLEKKKAKNHHEKNIPAAS